MWYGKAWKNFWNCLKNNMPKPAKAYKNLQFLNSPDAREIRILAEYLEPKSRFRKFQIENTIVFFGSARLLPADEVQRRMENLREKLIPEELESSSEFRKLEKYRELSQYYEDARELARRLTEYSLKLPPEEQFIICSGGGPGIMEAANRGAAEAGGKTIGLGISLPNMQEEPNPYITPELNFEFHYFFMRKFWFAYLSRALVIFPGGFGTLDELFEILTLIQTRKISRHLPVVIYGTDFWKNVINLDYLRDHYLINPDDERLYTFCSDVEQAYSVIVNHISTHQSAR